MKIMKLILSDLGLSRSTAKQKAAVIYFVLSLGFLIAFAGSNLLTVALIAGNLVTSAMLIKRAKLNIRID